ncbi:structural maintenance of chromosomes protein 2-like protein [Dermatophagoides farinae]|uniref:Structural maintenance of chromosomes protein n=1 Tax=Dermatophagoides farinae TaxID=6954 RepID=A0A9D4SE80_DERFA|nr:structural maintenance of chromosomes protein 2-like [Dermatophagoides farinae]KAH7638934.1 structural maintenance of chromosomes protein 2-like protein [Dermatophagoides farinae]
MFIKKLILDGFKSYGKRVEITDFDPSFNAITGFNGSGKSNILDAICFVLGLSKLELARCHTLNDLIYKNGHAGVTTASVTMEIDNTDGKFSHSDYSNSPVIVVRREINMKNQSKYYIDGFCVTKEKLMDFFQLVSLNIQNPHFLIMQGKIVKVVSMKPTEILSMIEEAVGVSVYENKKKQNLIRIEKCDKSLNEIGYLIDESIRPKLNRICEEQKALREYHTIKARYDQMFKISIAHRYLKDKHIVDMADTNVESHRASIQAKEDEKFRLISDSETLAKQIETLQKRLDASMGGDLRQFETNVNQKQNILQQMNMKQKLKQDQLDEEQNELTTVQKKLNKETKILTNKQNEFDELKKTLEQLKNEHETNEKLFNKAQEDLEAINFGKSKGIQGEKAATLTHQLMTTKDTLADVESRINKCKLIIEHTTKELTTKNKQIKSDKDVYDGIIHDIEKRRKEMEQLQQEMNVIDFSEENFEEMKQINSRLKNDILLLQDKINHLRPSVPFSKFKCPDSLDIDEESIYGVVCDLFTINHPEQHSVAIEKVCGGRLFNVIVSSDEVGAKLIKKNLKERRTFLPLNKITGRDTDIRALRLAEQLVGRGNVHYAINLVSFDNELKNAMKYVFGDTMLCPNMNMAKKIAFANGIMKRVVTYDGEIFDPTGTLTGGALKNSQSSLEIIGEIKSIEEELHLHRIRKQQAEDELKHLDRNAKQFEDKKSKLLLKQQEIDGLNLRLQESCHYVTMKDIEDMKQRINDEQNSLKQLANEKSAINDRIKEIEYKIQNSESTKKQELKEAKNYLSSIQKQCETTGKQLQNDEKQFVCLEQELLHHRECVDVLDKQIEKIHSDIEQIKKELLTIQNEIDNCQMEMKCAQEKYDEYKQQLNEKSKEIQKLQKQSDMIRNLVDEIGREIKLKTYEMEKIETSIHEAQERLRSMLHKYQWIKDEAKDFHSDQNEYRILNQMDFDENVFFVKLKSLKLQQESLGKSVNMKANIMHGQMQKEFEELLHKRDVTLKDRKKLIQYMEKVEKEKDKELRKAWKKINENFGAIFGTLLPNANARLAPVSSRIKDGLEIKVAFGDVWKESLSELSGGQRSLVALSLVLSLLKYYPAPLYILDEIDAALDQSHTQNIGLMIRRHFKNAQFIIVSLKDDMFNNANVLFQTKFIDGFSTVDRIKL